MGQAQGWTWCGEAYLPEIYNNPEAGAEKIDDRFVPRISLVIEGDLLG